MIKMQLKANPDFYDYMHYIFLYEDGTCKFIDGGGQNICLELKGTYKMIYDNEHNNSGSLTFKFKNETIDKNITVNFRIQEDLYVLQNEIIWNSTIQDWPFSIYTKRFIFDIDPFIDFYGNRQCLYFWLNQDKESVESMKIFYPSNDEQTKQLKDLNEIELNKAKELDQQFYAAYIKNPTMKASDLDYQK